MAISVLQKTSANGGGAATQAVSFGSLPSTGNSVVVAVACRTNFNQYSCAVTDNQSGNVYTQLAVAQTVSSSGSNTFIFWCPSITSPSGTFTVTATFSVTSGSGNPSGQAVAIMEVSGLGSSVDQTGSFGASSSATSGSVTAGGANTSSNELVVAACAEGNYSGSATNILDPANSGYTSWALVDTGSLGTGFEASYKIISGPETSSAAWTWTPSTLWSAVIATIAAAGGGGGNSASIAWVK